jgi:hypothetical protein
VSLGDLEIVAGREAVRRVAVEPAFGVEGGAEVVVAFDPPSSAGVHVYAREIADGDLVCTLGAQCAAVRMDLSLAARIVTEGLARGLVLPREESAALGKALAKGQQG